MSTFTITALPHQRRYPMAAPLGLSALLTLGPGVQAADPLNLEETLVEASDLEGEWIYREPRSVSTITRTQIDQRAPRMVADILEDSSGVYTAAHQREVGLSVNIRGMQDYGRVNMNIDGMRQNFNINGHQQRNGTVVVDPELLSTVDIEKGTQSGQGGAGVLGGIATFRTLEAQDFLRDGKEFGGRIRAGHGIGRLGNGTYYNGSQVFALGNSIGDVLVGTSERRFGDYWAGRNNMDNLGPKFFNKDYHPDNFRSWKTTEVGNTGSVTRSRIVKVGVNLPHDQRLKLTYLETDADVKDSWASMDDSNKVYYPLYGINEYSAINWGLDYSYNPDSELIDFTAKAYFVRNQIDRWNRQSGASLNTGNWYPAYTDTNRTDTWGLQAQNITRLNIGRAGTLKWTYGGEFFQDQFDARSTKVKDVRASIKPYAEGITPDGTRTMASIFNTLQYVHSDWLILDAGLRYDHYRLQGESGMTRYSWSVERQRDVMDPLILAVDQQLGHFSPTLGFGVMPGIDGVQLFGRWGQGWRPPAVSEMLVAGMPHGGGSVDLFPNNRLKPETSRDWELGVNLFKNSVLFTNDKLAAKVSYFDTRIDNYVFMSTVVGLPGDTIRRGFGAMANVNSHSATRFRGVEYQLDYDMGRAYTRLSYTHMIGKNDFCAKTFYLGGAKKVVGRYSQKYQVDSPALNNASTCRAIFGSAAFMPADRGALKVGFRLLEDRLNTGVQIRYSPGNGRDLKARNYSEVLQAAWPAYTVYDWYASYRATPEIKLSLALDNVTDEAYNVAMADLSNVALSRGRTLSGMIEYTF